MGEALIIRRDDRFVVKDTSVAGLVGSGKTNYLDGNPRMILMESDDATYLLDCSTWKLYYGYTFYRDGTEIFIECPTTVSADGTITYSHYFSYNPNTCGIKSTYNTLLYRAIY